MRAAALDFGARVLVYAETARVIAEPHPDGHRFKQASSGRDSGRFVAHTFSGPNWPGEGVPLEWEPHPAFDPDLALNGKVTVRLRRLTLPMPEVGLVIGWTWRREGFLTHNGQRVELSGPTRSVTFYEVALPPSETKARLVLVHPNDLRDVGDPPPAPTGPVKAPFVGWNRP